MSKIAMPSPAGDFVTKYLRDLRAENTPESLRLLRMISRATGRKLAMDEYKPLPHMRGNDVENSSTSSPGGPLPQDVETVVDQIHALLAARLGASSDGDPELDELIIRLRAAINGEPQTHDKKPAMDGASIFVGML